MKQIIFSFILGLFLIGNPFSCNAQVSRGLVKAATKASKYLKGSKAGTKRFPITKPRPYKPEKPARPLTYKCYKCNGYGKIRIWNSYYGFYQYIKCSNCYGRGRITRIVRY